ncbi:MAG: amidohydrolase family protein [Betaproteobacteria bacterium]|nr:amidohydrolase family protein [Betaproteobacteria bacterium]
MHSDARPLALVGGRLIDGLGHDPVPRATVLVENGRVIAAGKASAIRLPRGTQVLDAAGCAVLPGMIDCHVHSTYRARDVRRHLLNTPTYNVLRSTHILEETLACGVTTARDMGGADAGFRESIREGYIRGPRLLISIVMISQTGGHGDSWVPAGVRLQKRAWLPSGIVDGTEDMRKLVRSLLMAGADFIKICTSGGITSVTDSWDEPQLTADEIRTAVTEATAKRKRVAVHAEGIEGVRRALSADIHSLEHGWFLDEACVDSMIKRGIWWVPTLALVPLSVERRKIDPAWSNQQLAREDDKDAAIYSAMKKQVPLWKDAVKRGIKVAMGTDQSHRLLVGENLVELEFMVKWLGMSEMEAIVASTTRAAECIEQPELGALAPGKIADVLVIDGDPLEDIRVLQQRSRIKLVMKDGKAYHNHLPR